MPKIQLRQDVSANWQSRNPILLKGEFGIETDTNKFKIGDGETSWNSLEYITPTKTSDLVNDSGYINISAVPTLTSQLTNDSGFLTQHQDISGKQDRLTAGTNISIDANNVISATNLSSGNYLNLDNKPQINGVTLSGNKTSAELGILTSNDLPTKTSDLTNDSGYINISFVPTLISELTNDSGFITSADLPTLATVATSGDYDDLSNKPTIPTVNNATITFTQGGTTKGTITLNQSSDATIALNAGGGGAVDSVNGKTGDVVLDASDVGALADTTTIPAKTSDLTNDSNFATVSQIPTNNNQLTNGAGYITNSALAGFVQNTATGTSSLTISGTPTTNTNAVNIGYGSATDGTESIAIGNSAEIDSANGAFSIAIGSGARTDVNSAVAIGAGADVYGVGGVSIGSGASANGSRSLALGVNANAMYNSSIQIGYGTNSDSNTLSVGFYNTQSTHYNWQLLDGTTGLIPDARISSNIARTSAIPDISTKQDTLVSGTNIKTVNNTSLLGSGNIDTSQIFFAIYGTTTTNQITQALASGKAIFCIKSTSVDHIYCYSGTLEGSSAYVFSRVYQNTTEVVYVSSSTNVWNTITKTLADDTLSNVLSIDSGSAVATALDAKVNKSGDTMTGGLSIDTDDNNRRACRIDNISTTAERDIEFNATSASHRVGAIRGALSSDGTTCLMTFGCCNPNNDALSGLQINRTNTSISCTFPNTTCVDGQWDFSSPQTIISTAVSLNGSTDLPYTVTLPNDGHIYEVMIRADANTGNATGNWFIVGIKSNVLTNNYIFVCGTATQAARTAGSQGTVIIPMKYGTNNLTLRRSTNYTGSTQLFSLGYRRVGTNT